MHPPRLAKMEDDKTVTDLLESHLALAKGQVKRIFVDIGTLKDLLAEGCKIDVRTDRETTLQGIPVIVDPSLKERQVVLETYPEIALSEEMKRWILENEKPDHPQ